MDERPESAQNLTLEDFYRKEFIQVLDVQTQALTDNIEATWDILAPEINPPLPSLDNDPKEEDVDSLVKMLPRSLQPNNDVLCAEMTLFNIT
jgi:RNAse (barnase) inhibitor barstar